jgi:hypothetical protein
MVRRWSCLNNLNLKPHAIFVLRFENLKLTKAINYKNFSLGLTKFKRAKLAQKKRNTSWMLYTAILRFWIKDYNLFKKIAKLQFLHLIFVNSVLIYDFNCIKKKNILNNTTYSTFLTYSVSNLFFNYFWKKYHHNNTLRLIHPLINNNFLIANYDTTEFLHSDKVLPLLRQFENTFYNSNYSISIAKTQLPVFHDFIFLRILQIYKILLFYFYLIAR